MKKIEYIIYQACYNANIDKFTRIINNIKLQEQEEKLKKLFNKHMKDITNYIISSYFWKTGKLSEKFIKELHKIHYPPNYKETKKNKHGIDIVFMIPGKYKIFPNFPRVSPKDVPFQMQKLIKLYNENINKERNKFEFIGDFIINFFKIHPFGHGNGAIASLLMDLLLIKNSLKPIGFKKYYQNIQIKIQIYKTIEKSIITGQSKYFINILKQLKD